MALTGYPLCFFFPAADLPDYLASVPEEEEELLPEFAEKLARRRMEFFFPAPPVKETPAPKTCPHKCVRCGMYFQHEAGTMCSKAKHKGCSKK